MCIDYQSINQQAYLHSVPRANRGSENNLFKPFANSLGYSFRGPHGPEYFISF